MSLLNPSPARGSRILPIPISAILITLSSCGGDSVTRPTEPDVRLSVHASGTSGNPANPLSFRATAWNAGGGSVTYWHDCCHEAVDLMIVNPEGTQVFFDTPVFCRCAQQQYPLPPSPLSSTLSFRGMIWEEGRLVPAPSGRYLLIVRFVYQTDSGNVRPELLERTIPFTWYSS